MRLHEPPGSAYWQDIYDDKQVVSMRGITVRQSPFVLPPVEAGLKSGLITRQNAGTIAHLIQ